MYSQYSQFNNAKKKLFASIILASVLIYSSPLPVLADDVLVDTPSAEAPVPVETPEPSSESVVEPIPDASVTTGDAVSQTDVGTNANVSDTDTTSTAPETEDIDNGTNSSTENEGLGEGGEEGDNGLSYAGEITIDDPAEDSASTTPSDVDLNVNNDSYAQATTTASSNAETGNNTASGSNSATIETGDAYAVGNIINVINLNLLNSEGLFSILNGLFGGGFGNIFINGFDQSSTTPICDGCGGAIDLSANATSTAEISNELVVRSGTGGNTASSGGNATIETGDAYAVGNIFNLVNTNFINSNYLMLVMNNFGDWGGNLIFPNKDIFANLFGANSSSNGCCGGSVSVNNENSADINNTTNSTADTGGNEATGDGAEINTGNAGALNNVVNQVNGNYTNSDSFIILLRVSGNWGGSVYGLPDGVSWTDTGNGIMLYGLGGESGSGLCCGNSDLSVLNNNQAKISNNVSVYALTGENKVRGGNASINTGDAYATSNTVNLVNTNVIGRNFTLAIINIMGNWNGSVSFGQPNLWIGGYAEIQNGGFRPRAPIVYHMTIVNRGDADATGVVLKGSLNGPGFFHSSGNKSVNIPVGNIPKGGSKEIEVYAQGMADIPSGVATLIGNLSAISNEPEADPTDNTEEIVVVGQINPEFSDSTPVGLTPDPNFFIAKSNNAPEGKIHSPAEVLYSINIENTGGPAYHSTLFDVITDENGNIIHEKSWDLNTIFPGEKINVDYTVSFSDMTAGVYTNEAWIESIGRNPSLNPFYGMYTDSNVVDSKLIVLANEEIIVSGGASDLATTTPPLISEGEVTRTLPIKLPPLPTPSIPNGSNFPPLLPTADFTLPPPPALGLFERNVSTASESGRKLPPEVATGVLIVALLGISLERFSIRHIRHSFTSFL